VQARKLENENWRLETGKSAAKSHTKNAAEGRNDFIHKLGIAFKELRETRIWIKLIIKARLLPLKRMSALLDECEQLCHIIARSLMTANASRSPKKS
jgi:four helix bundle protein